MKCPKCSLPRPLNDTVCRRCKYVFDEDRFLNVAPPRATRPGAPPKVFGRRSARLLDELRYRPWIPPVASIVPGLGHVIQGRTWLGLLYGILVGLFLTLAITFYGEGYAQVFLGLAVSTHATCILDTTPWGRAREVWPRTVGMVVLMPLVMALYWRLGGRLSQLFTTVEYVPVDRRLPRAFGSSVVNQLVVMAVLFVLSVTVSTWAGRKLSSRDQSL